MPGELDLANNGITRVYDGNLDAATYLHERGDESKADKNRKISAAPPAFLASGWEPPKPIDLPLEAWRPDMQDFVQNGYLSQKLARVAEAEVQLKKLKLDKAAQERKRAKSEGIRPVKDEAILTDDFSEPRPDLWTVFGSDSRYQDDSLSIIKPSLDTTYLRSKVKHPRDFELELKFKTTGGQKWKSTGIRFDVDESGDNSHFVYTSVFGAKVHLAHTIGGKNEYTQAVAKRSIKLNQIYTLGLKVRDRLINVSLDGNFCSPTPCRDVNPVSCNLWLMMPLRSFMA